MSKKIKIGSISVGKGEPLILIAGPCVIESRDKCIKTAEEIKKIAGDLKIPFIFKASYDKANRTSIKSFRGPGLEKGLEILKDVKEKLNVNLLTDVHCRKQITPVSEVVDILQIPAFLCRQTDLILSAASTSKVINIKKGQFLAPWDIKNVIEKVTSAGNEKVMVTERGVTFGYNNLVSDMKSLPIMRRFGYPVIFDATHSVQQPGGLGNASSGNRDFVPVLARAAVAAGCEGLYLEVHPDPEEALSDGPNMIDFTTLRELLEEVNVIRESISKLKEGR